MPIDNSSESGSCGCKVGRITAQYDLSGLDTELANYWTDDSEDQLSTRQLATYVNHRVLEHALETAGRPPKEGEVENTYRLLTDESASSGDRVQTRNELERDGLPIEQIESDFVSHQTIYNHLTTCLDVTLDAPSDEERLERSAEKTGALQSRVAAVTADTVTRLKRAGILSINEFTVAVSVTVTCEECLAEYTISDLLRKRSCDCQESART